MKQEPNGTWLADKLPVVVKDLPDGRGVALLSDADMAKLRDRTVVPQGAGVGLAVHGNGDGLHALVPVERPDGVVEGVLLTADQVYAVVKDRLGSGSLVWLLSCRAGSISGGFAARLAAIRGGDVATPVTDIWLGSEGSPDLPVTEDGRSWVVFNGGDIDGEGYDLLNEQVPVFHPDGKPVLDKFGNPVWRATPFDGITAVAGSAADAATTSASPTANTGDIAGPSPHSDSGKTRKTDPTPTPGTENLNITGGPNIASEERTQHPEDTHISEVPHADGTAGMIEAVPTVAGHSDDPHSDDPHSDDPDSDDSASVTDFGFNTDTDTDTDTDT